MAVPRNTFEPLAARNLIAAALAPLFKTDTDAKQGFPLVVIDREVNGARVVTMATGTEAVIVYQPYSKASHLRALLGDDLLLTKVLGNKAVDPHLGHCVCRIRFIPSQSRKPGRVEVTGWHSSSRAVVELRKLREGMLPAGMGVGYAEDVLEGA